MNEMNEDFQWIPFYKELAMKLITYNDRRGELFELIKSLASEQPLMKYLHFEREDWWGPRNHEIDPFSVIGIMNRGTTDSNRTAIAKVLAKTFDLKTPVPVKFTGIPILNNRNSFFGGVSELWDLFVLALQAGALSDLSDDFQKAFDLARSVSGNGLAYVTMGLFWVRPDLFMPLDSHSRQYLLKNFDMNISSAINGSDYVSILSALSEKLSQGDPVRNFSELSHEAWLDKGSSGFILDDSDLDPYPALLEDMPKMASSDDGISKNIILYGAPGTGKTYRSIQYAVAIIENKPLDIILAEEYREVFKRFLKYKDVDRLIEFTTFHQSYSYEEFIEGIRPVMEMEQNSETANDIEYKIHDGIFKSFCDKAGTPISTGTDVDLGISKTPSVWKVSLEGTGNNPTRTESMANNHIRIGWDEYGKSVTDATDFSKLGGKSVLNAFYNRMQIGDLVFSCYSNTHIDAIGVVTGEPQYVESYSAYKRLRKVRWLVKNINENIVDLNAGKTMTLAAVYQLNVTPSDAMDLLRKVNPALFSKALTIPNRVFIIDEINRGNISKIFGELITLIEPSKRITGPEEMKAMLPYSGKKFGVPPNVYIIGTMNTADRSIALLDTALRRRFQFVEMHPETALLRDLIVDGIGIGDMLDTLNRRITVLLDREHVVGHAYLLPLIEDPTMERLAWIFKFQIIPLLQEYFYDDYEKIQLVLGDNQKPDNSTRIIVVKQDANQLFGNAQVPVSEYYQINYDALTLIDAYAFL